jgi:cation diffusion facilitator family transporter
VGATESQMIAAQRRTARIRRAGYVGIVGNGVLAVTKIVAGFLAHSAAVISDGVDSILDVLASLITVLTAGVMSRPPDVNHPYGHSRAETIATKALSFLIFFAGAQLAISAVQSLISGAELRLPSPVAFAATMVSIAGKIALALYKFSEGKRIHSPVLIADAKNMRGDIVISVAVLAGIFLSVLFQVSWIDTVTALVVSLYILWVAFGLFMQTNTELMEGHADTSTYQQIFDAVDRVAGAEHPHRTRVREIGGYMIIDLDIEVDGQMNIRDAHEIARRTEQQIRNSVPNVYDVLVHVEPIGNVETDESYGLSRRKLDEHLGT